MAYDVCIKQERGSNYCFGIYCKHVFVTLHFLPLGFCRFQVSESSTATDSFQLDNTGGTPGPASIGANCPNQYIFVNGLVASTTNKYCGAILSTVEADTQSGTIVGMIFRFHLNILFSSHFGLWYNNWLLTDAKFTTVRWILKFTMHNGMGHFAKKKP